MTAATPTSKPIPQRRGVSRREGRWGMLLAAPATLHSLFWIGIPVAVAIGLSFTSYDMVTSPEFVGFDNYLNIFQDPIFWKAMRNNLFLAGLGIPISMLLALLIAIQLNKGLHGQGIFRTLTFLPHVTATVAVAMIWLWIFAPTGNGLANIGLSAFGIEPVPWLTSADTAIWAVLIVTIWQGIGLKMLIYLAALQGLPNEVYEAADIDGAGPVRRFVSITVPMLRPATFFVLVTSIIANFQTFDLIYVLTLGGPANSTTVITYQIYQTAFQQLRMGLATAQSVILLLVLVILTFISRKVVGGTDGD
jgi:multiple sugar transport system permease protein